MNGPRLTQQTTAPSLPLTRHPAARPAPGPRSAHSGIFRGPLQLLLEEPGWNVLRSRGGPRDAVPRGGARARRRSRPPCIPRRTAAPLLALPALTLLALYLRGLYRTRLRALVLDGLAPAVSAVSVAAMAVAAIGLLANGRIPDPVRVGGGVAARAGDARGAAARRWRWRNGGRAAAGWWAGRC